MSKPAFCAPDVLDPIQTYQTTNILALLADHQPVGGRQPQDPRATRVGETMLEQASVSSAHGSCNLKRFTRSLIPTAAVIGRPTRRF
jgi:hypothetical protein